MAEGKNNPSFEGAWIDNLGRTWLRKGKRGRTLEYRRIRTLLGSDDVPLVVWRSFQVELYIDTPSKLAAADRLGIARTGNDDVVASEWRAVGGRLLLILEHRC